MCKKLGVEQSARKETITEIFRNELLSNHPEKYQNANAATIKLKEARITEVILAYRFIELYRKERGTW
jgi:DnaJ-class molecular chaperone